MKQKDDWQGRLAVSAVMMFTGLMIMAFTWLMPGYNPSDLNELIKFSTDRITGGICGVGLATVGAVIFTVSLPPKD